jgi:septum formation inhibitor-activating ATPase MinD
LPGKAYEQMARRLLGERIPHRSVLNASPRLWQRLSFWRRG